MLIANLPAQDRCRNARVPFAPLHLGFIRYSLLLFDLHARELSDGWPPPPSPAHLPPPSQLVGAPAGATGSAPRLFPMDPPPPRPPSAQQPPRSMNCAATATAAVPRSARNASCSRGSTPRAATTRRALLDVENTPPICAPPLRPPSTSSHSDVVGAHLPCATPAPTKPVHLPSSASTPVRGDVEGRWTATTTAAAAVTCGGPECPSHRARRRLGVAQGQWHAQAQHRRPGMVQR